MNTLLLVVLAIIPDPTLTPGSIRTTDTQEICTHGTASLRHMTRERSDHLLALYGLPPGPHSDVELDHLIPLGIGGSDDDKNIWAEPRQSIEAEWPAEKKDQLEWKLRALVCQHKLDVTVAQHAFTDDWTAAWQLYVGKNN